MKWNKREISLLGAFITGALTIILCLAVADGMIGLNQPPAGTYAGVILF